jgi:ArsR family transcriptional regulator
MSDQPPVFEVKAELFKALAHPARIRALEVLADGERSVSDLQPDVGIEPAHLSQQLGVLRRAGLVATRKEGTTVYYSIKDPLLIDLLAVAKALLITSLAETRDLLDQLRGS